MVPPNLPTWLSRWSEGTLALPEEPIEPLTLPSGTIVAAHPFVSLEGARSFSRTVEPGRYEARLSFSGPDVALAASASAGRPWPAGRSRRGPSRSRTRACRATRSTRARAASSTPRWRRITWRASGNATRRRRRRCASVASIQDVLGVARRPRGGARRGRPPPRDGARASAPALGVGGDGRRRPQFAGFP